MKGEGESSNPPAPEQTDLRRAPLGAAQGGREQLSWDAPKIELIDGMCLKCVDAEHHHTYLFYGSVLSGGTRPRYRSTKVRI